MYHNRQSSDDMGQEKTEHHPSILIVDDDESIRWVLKEALTDEGFRVETLASVKEALQAIEEQSFSVVITDVLMPGDDGFQLLKRLSQQKKHLPVILMTAQSDFQNAVKAYELGAFDYLPKPFDLDNAIDLAHQAVTFYQQHHMDDHQSNTTSIHTVDDKDFENIMIGEASSMQTVYQAIGKLAKSKASVLIKGASGTGKELVARALHKHSRQSQGPFIALNMAAIPQELIESELFGHEKGAFTGANQKKTGRFEQAQGGTLFLDEIGDMPLETQTRLLRVLSEGSFYRIGGKQPISSDVRIISATHQDLSELVKQGKFREDLYHRIHVIPLQLPDLKDRKSDIPLLITHFLKQAAIELEEPLKILTEEALKQCLSYSWPGNIRQLENMCRWLMVMCPGKKITMNDLPEEVGLNDNDSKEVDILDNEKAKPDDEDKRLLKKIPLNWEVTLESFVKEQYRQGDTHILQSIQPVFEDSILHLALSLTQGHKQKAATLLGWGRNTLTRKLNLSQQKKN